MRPFVVFATLLVACAPAGTDTDADTDAVVADTGTDTDTDIVAPPPQPPAPGLEHGREVYEENRCPRPGAGAVLPKDAIVQAWACNGANCWPVPELLTVVRGPDADEAILDGCSGAARFEVSWIALIP